MNTTVKNPYVGPRTFQKEDGAFFHGREREARDLLALIASERLILFYAQSGAGKSSLLNTRVIPELEKGDFEVLPVGRVLGDLPEGVSVDNVYAFNLMNSILQQKTDPAALANKTISEFLAGLDINDNGYCLGLELRRDLQDTFQWRQILMIDQFEEIFTTHLDAWLYREDFFRQLGQALTDNPYLTVILIMRDDYIASLDLYAHLLPGGLRTRYYMQRLTREAALKAIKRPVENIRPFADGVAEKLVEDLSGILVYKAGGTLAVQPGQYIEPVQLQVVCRGLWDNLPVSGSQITFSDLSEVGDVNQSLESFYTKRVTEVAQNGIASERQIREWFNHALITANKTRNMVLQGTVQTEGLSNQVIQLFQGDLIRVELRAGQLWYELSHDRLVDPVLTSNEKWFEQNLSLFQRRVLLWIQQGHSDSLLLRDNELIEAEKEAKSLLLTSDEKEFLEACRILRKRIERDRWQRRIISMGLVISLAMLAITVISYFNARESQAVAEEQRTAADGARIEADEQKRIAEEQASKALAGSLSAQAASIKGTDHELALLLAMEAYQKEQNLLTRTTLFQLMQYTPIKRFFGYEGAISSIAVSPNGNLVAVSSGKRISILDQETTKVIFFSAAVELGLVNSLAFNNDGSLLIAGGCLPDDCAAAGGQITLWDVSVPDAPQLLADLHNGHTAQVKSIAFSPDGNYIASGSYDSTVILWEISNAGIPKAIGKPMQPQGSHSLVTSLAFNEDGAILVSGMDDGSLNLWNISAPSAVKLEGVFHQHSKAVYDIAFSPAGNGEFASASDDNTVVLWDWDENSRSLDNPQVLMAHEGFVRSVAYNASGKILASSGFDGQIILWDTKTGERIGAALEGHNKPINAISFGYADSENILISGSNDRTMIFWDLSVHQPLSQPVVAEQLPLDVDAYTEYGDMKAFADGQQITLQEGDTEKVLTGHNGVVNTLEFSKQKIEDRLLLISASEDQSVLVWDVTNVLDADVYLKLEGFESPVSGAYFSSDGYQIITIERNGYSTRWLIDPSDWLVRGCKAVHRNLTLDEWGKYFLLPDAEYHKTCSNDQ